MTKKIRLQGLSFRKELEGEVIDFANEMIYLSLVPWEFCNWACQYCHEDRRVKEKGELALDEIRGIIREAGELGVRSILLLGGEVLLRSTWDTTCEVVQEAYNQGIVTLIYTNGSQISQGMAEWLAERNVSIVLKVDSLIEEKYDALTQRSGSFRSTMQAIEIVRSTSIGEVVCENRDEKLVRLLFSTVGNALNLDEYVSLARFATNHDARWMMEALNHRGDAVNCPNLTLDTDRHSKAMQWAILLNPEQEHDFHLPCRLLSCLTIRKKGEIAVCPQDYNFLGNIRRLGSLKASWELVRNRVETARWRNEWTGSCSIKNNHF